MVNQATILAGFVIALFLAGFMLFLAGELMIAGGVFFLATFVIYLRETRL